MNTKLMVGLLPLAAMVLGCASSAPPAREASSVEAEKVDMWGPQSPQPAWWSRKKPCPEGAMLVGAPPPREHVLECRLPSGRQHGFSSVWFPNGHEGTLIEYQNGMRHGLWMHWQHGRKMVEGEFRNDRRHGRWTYWFDEWTDFDTASRMEPLLPVMVEVYNNGLLLSTTRAGDGSPEKMSPAERSVSQTNQ